MSNADNPVKGKEFENRVQTLLRKQGHETSPRFGIELGISTEKKSHEFDLGSDTSNIIVECKAHCWTEGGNSPSAKMAVWNEAMYYFLLAPSRYRKLFFALLSRKPITNETLVEYYLRRFTHMVPEDVEIWEYDEHTHSALRKHPLKNQEDPGVFQFNSL